jgi:hypothetical protein
MSSSLPGGHEDLFGEERYNRHKANSINERITPVWRALPQRRVLASYISQ